VVEQFCSKEKAFFDMTSYNYYKMKRFFIALTFLFVLVGNAAYAQVITANQFQNKADAAFEIKDYNTALAHYLTILNDEPDRADLYWNTAEAARNIRHFVVAEKYYEALSKNPQLSQAQPSLDYKLATVKKSLGKYDAAIALFQRYSTASGEMAATAITEIEASKWAKEMTQVKPYEVIHLDDKVNTFYIDAAPVQYGANLYYTSAYFKTPEATPVTNVYSSNMKDKPLPLAFNSQAEGVHTAYFAPNTEGSRLYYNQCEQTESGSFKCKIFVRAKIADGSWDLPVMLDTATINVRGYTATQPNIGFDKIKGKDVLYFVSDRKGGKGGLDIWAADIEANGTINAPVNLSAINTNKDDITPYFLAGPQILFFSTEGYKSLGGFDIFKTELSASGFAEPANIGYPMNSSFDDMYPSFSPENARYFFVSNRPGGMCERAEKDCVCNDIYQQNITVSLDASTFLADGDKALLGCNLDLVDLETGLVVKNEVNMNGNNFKFPIDPNKKYRLIATKKGYQSDTVDFNTMGLYLPNTLITKELKLNPNLKLQIYVFDKIGRKAIDGAKVEIRSADSKILYATETLKGNLMTWDGLEYGKTYMIVGTKETYDGDFKNRSIETWSSTMTKFVYTDSLYLKPFSGLPLTLYYDNDCPNPRTRNMTTIYTYSETYGEYYAKQTEYLNSYYTENHDVSAKGANEIADFFQNKVKLGYDKLNDFSNKLIQYMSSGYGMEIVLEGYASPLAEPEYNRILTSRRVSAVINHFYKYDNGIFRQYIKNGQLRLRVEPYGESKADIGVSDNAKDRRKSVYSVAAMKERKVEIIEINEFQYNSKDEYSLSDALGIYFDTDEFGNKRTNTTLGDVDDAHDKSRFKKGKNRSSKASTDGLGMRSSNEIAASKTGIAKKRYELVLVDTYTGEVINNNASVELFDQYADRMVGKAKRKGKSYYYNIEKSKDYLVKGSVAGYSESSVSKYGNYTEGGGTDTMYLSPFSGLPLSLYFDNDKPAGSATSESTATNYDVTYRPFVAKKREFLGAYNKMMASQGGIVTEQNEMNMFFDKDLKGGYEHLAGFSSILKTYLQKGYQLEVVLEGFASPLANAEYNQKLAGRRVNSVINYFSSYANGSMKKYITSGQLKISVQPLGEVNTTVSDDGKNASSIYSVEASRERKVVIKDIVIRNNVFYKK
jgi:outer membrane protein OmpA-like peptidoglycan-associated protein